MHRFENIRVILNVGAGSTQDVSGDILRVLRAHDLPDPVIKVVSGEDVPPVFDALRADSCDLLIVLGGDGTSKSGAIAARRENIPFIPLPGGTMNILPQALYGTQDWQEALEVALSSSEPRWLSCGLVEEEIFLVGMIVGDPIVMADARENVREGQMIKALQKVPQVLGAISDGDLFQFKTDVMTGKKMATLMNIVCPDMLEHAAREAFEVSTVKHLNLNRVMEIGATAIITGWRDSDYVDVARAQTITLSGPSDFDILLDGEPSHISGPAEVVLEPQGVKVLAPPRAAQKDELS